MLCLQWSENNGNPFLLSVSNKVLPKPLSVLEQSENEIISVINAGLHLVREDIPFEGEQVYVTIPDMFTNSVLVSSDEDMTENDAWDFALWTIQQRWSTDSKFENFGRSFSENSNQLFAISISTTFTEPIKMAILELGGEPIWMGTESSVFFGLNPEKGCTVFYVNKNGYNYYQYSQSSFQNGIAKFSKGNWNFQALKGSDKLQDVFKGQLLVAGSLSEKRKAHFKGHRIKQIVSLTGINYESNILPKDVKEENLYVFSALATGNVKGVAINFFDQPGIQPYNFVKKELIKPLETVKIKSSADKRKTSKKLNKKKKNEGWLKAFKIKSSADKRKPSKKLNKKKDSVWLKAFLYFFFFVTITGMLVYDQRPELFRQGFSKFNNLKLNNLYSTDVDSSSLKVEEEVEMSSEVVEDVTSLHSESSIKSQILVSTALKALSLTDSHEIILLSISDGNMDLELLGSKTMDAPIDSIGDVLNYSLRQVPSDSQFKHGYLVQYKASSEFFIEGSKEQIDSLRFYVENIQNSLFKELNKIEKKSKTQIPIIIRLNGDNYIQTFLNYILSKTKNLALEKFVYKGKSLQTLPTAVFYMSIYTNTKTDLVE